MDPVSLLTRAETLLAHGRPGPALPLLHRAARGGGDRFFSADVHHRRAEALRALSRFEEALKDYWAAHRLYGLCGVPSERWKTLLGASACLRVLSRYREADRMWRGVRGKFAPSAEFDMEFALVQRGLGRMSGAVRILRGLIPRLKKAGDEESLQHAWWALAGAERFSGEYGKALRSFGEAARLARRNGDPSAEAYAWCGEAGCLRILGDGAASLQKYKKAHACFVRAKDRFGEAYGLCGQGNALRVYGDPRKTIPLYRRSAALYTKVGDTGSRAFAFWGLGGSFRRMKRHEDSRRHYHAALRDFKKVGDHRGVIMGLLGLGRADGDARRLKEALKTGLKERHPYEAALAALELARLAGRPLPLTSFRRFGVPSTAVSSWGDLP